jgi:hypothetical protein
VFTTGTLEITERDLDVAIDGEGFFAVTLPDGSTGYTRDGGFHLNADGKLVTGGGNVVLPEITVPSDTLEISIDPEGRVSGRTAGSPDTSTSFGQLTIHRFVNPSGMLAVGANVLRPTPASGAPITGHPRHVGPRPAQAGLRRALQRADRQRAGQPHRRAARLRGEQPRHPGQRPDAVDGHQPVPLVPGNESRTPMNIFAILGLCAAVLFGNGNGGGGGDKDKIEVKLKATTYVRGLDVTIGELCEITPEGTDALAIAKIKFGRAPVAGHARTISRTEIVQSIAASGQDISGLKFAGSNEIVVQPVLTDLSTPEVLDAATAALQAVLALEGGDVEFTAPQRMRLIQAPPGRRSQEFVARLRGDKTGPNAAVIEVEIVVDGESYKKIPITFRTARATTAS